MKEESKQVNHDQSIDDMAGSKPPASENSEPIAGHRIWLAISNLNIFALGYFLAGQKKRWYFFLGGGLLLLILAQISNASKQPLLWAMLFLLYFIAMAVDLWFLLKKTPPVPQKFLQKYLKLIPILAILINFLFYGGFFLYRSTGNHLYQAGLEAQKKNDIYGVFGNWYAFTRYYRLSLNSDALEVQKPLGEVALLINSKQLVEEGEFNAALEAIERFNILYPESTWKKMAADISVDAYLGWAVSLAGQGNHAQGLDKIYDAVNFFPIQSQARQEEIDVAFSTHYLDWGIYLSEQEDFGTAVEKFEYLISRYPEAAEVQVAYEAAAQAYLDWAVQANEKEDYVQAASNLDTVLETYNKSDVVAEAEQLLPVTYLNSAIQLDTQSHFLLAMERLEIAKELGLPAEQEQEADDEYQNAIQLLARDAGVDGKIVLDEALEQSCTGVIPTHPSVGILEDEPGKVLNCCYVKGVSDCSRWIMSNDLKATTPGIFKYTLLRTVDSRTVQRCPYTGGHTLERKQYMAEVTIKLVATGELVASKIFYGDSPGGCPMVHFFSGLTDSIWGGSISNSIVDAWIAEVLK